MIDSVQQLDAGGPYAFPFTFDDGESARVCVGATLRDYFAAASLARIIDGVRPADQIARMAYQLADEMLKARQA